MQKIQLYLILIICFIAVIMPVQSKNNPEQIKVKLFSRLDKIEYIELKSSAIISPHNKTLYSGENWKIKTTQHKLILQNDRDKVNHFLPEMVILKPYQNNPVCISTSNISKRCYRGEIPISAKKDSIEIINRLSVVDYLYSVVSSEMPPGWSPEAVKAQAIVAHTFLLNKLKYRETISDSTQDQFYGGVAYENKDYKPYIQEVRNIIITDKNNQPVEALYHSTCAGKTLNNEDVFGNKSLNYLRSVNCPFDKESNFAKATVYTVSQEKLKNLLKTQNLMIKRDSAGKLKCVQTDNNIYNPYQFWLKLGQKLGWQAVPGIKYNIECNNGLCKLSSKGAGHAVGLCQWGAKGMAEKGYKYQEILKHYYKNIILSNID